MTFGTDPELGDINFYSNCLLAEITRLDSLENLVKQINELDLNQVNKLFNNDVPTLMEFDYRIAELRKNYLKKRLQWECKEL